MPILKKVMLIMLLCFNICSVAQAKDVNKAPEWRLYVAFLQKNVGSINRPNSSYEVAWIRRDDQEASLAKAFKLKQKKAVEGTKNRISISRASTSSSNYVILYNAVRVAPMWKGPDKPVSTIRFKKGSSIASIDTEFKKDAVEYKYLSHKKVQVINMIAAKTALNAQLQNPYIGDTPTSMQLKKPTPCTTDPAGKACLDYKNSRRLYGDTRG